MSNTAVIGDETVAWMSEAKSGCGSLAASPHFAFAHAGYGFTRAPQSMRHAKREDEMQQANRMRNVLFALAAFAAAALVPTFGFARTSTTFHNPGGATVKKDCAAVGGAFYSSGGDTVCIKGVNVVTCHGKKCTGTCGQCSARTAGGIKGVLRSRSGVKTLGGARSPKHGVRPVKVGGVKAHRLGHGRVVKFGGFKTKTMYRHPGGPTDQGGKGFNSRRNAGPSFSTAEHHGGRHH